MHRNIPADPIMTDLKLNRIARLWGKLCLPDWVFELSFVIGTRKDPRDPVIHLETANLVVMPSEKTGGGTEVASACLPGGALPEVKFNRDTNEMAVGFEVNFDLPAARRGEDGKTDPETDTPGGVTFVRTRAELEGRIVGEFEPRAYRYQNFEGVLRIEMPRDYVDKYKMERFFEIKLVFPLIWFEFSARKELWLQPVFISGSGSTPPTGSDFYPLLARANQIWAKCCVQFRAKCPKYVSNQNYRISTQAEATAFKDEVSVSDAIEVFMVERLDPETLWGGGATFSSGTASAKIVTGDNQLPGNDNHLAHELGHVVGLGHPGNPNGLVDSCPGSVMEPSGFFADNPEFQCRFNCRMAANPLLTSLPGLWCIGRLRPDQELF